MNIQTVYQDTSDRRTGREILFEELKKINFIEDYEFEIYDQYDEESYP